MKILSNKQWRELIKKQEELEKTIIDFREGVNIFVNNYNKNIKILEQNIEILGTAKNLNTKDIQKLQEKIEEVNERISKLEKPIITIKCNATDMTKEIKKSTKKVEKIQEGMAKELPKVLKQEESKVEPKKRGRKPKNIEDNEVNDGNKKSKKN